MVQPAHFNFGGNNQPPMVTGTLVAGAQRAAIALAGFVEASDILAAIEQWFQADPDLPTLFPGALWTDLSRATVLPFAGMEPFDAIPDQNTESKNNGWYVEVLPIRFKAFASTAARARRLGKILRDKLNYRTFVFADGIQGGGMFLEGVPGIMQDRDRWKDGTVPWVAFWLMTAHVTRPLVRTP